MIKKIILGAALLAISNTFAQQGTASPYSYYGFGDKHFKGANEIKSMGALAVYSDSLHINTLNPASYAKLQTTTFSVGASYKSTELKNANSSAKTNSGSFDYLSLAFPAGDFAIAAGIMPYSFVGYNIQNTKVNDKNTTESHQYTGDGGLNRPFLGVSYKINKNFSIGLDAAYLFGKTVTDETMFGIDNGLPLDTGSRIRNENNYSGFSINAGLNYQQALKKNFNLYAAATFSPEMKLKNDQTKTLSKVALDQQGNINESDARVSSNQDEKMLLPTNYSIGLGVGNELKWFVGAEYTATQTSKYNAYNTYDNASYNDYMKIGFGGFYTPKYNSLTSYFERMTYRAGVNYENTGLIINTQEIKGINANIGLGLPVGRQNHNSNINIGFEYGQRGNTNMGLIKENYYGFTVGLSFNDIWFQRRKYN